MIRTDWSQNEERKRLDRYGGIGYYRIVKPAEALKEFFDIDVIGKGFADLGKTSEDRMRYIFEKYDLVYVRQMDTPRIASDIISAGKYFKVPVIMDLDDNLLDIREDNPAFAEFNKATDRRAISKAIIALVDGLIVSTEPLKSAYSKLQKNIDVLPNFNDINDWPTKVRKYQDGMVRIGWAGSITHNQDLDMIMPVLAKLLKKYPNLRVEFMGGVTREKGEDVVAKLGVDDTQVGFLKGTLDWAGYPDALAATGWDIALAPLIDDTFNRGKSHIKWMEMSMFQIPVVASKVYPYYKNIGGMFNGLKTIQHGKTGFLVKTPEEWFDTLETLINKPDLRKRIGYNAYKYIAQNWQWSQNVWRWKTVIEKYLNEV